MILRTRSLGKKITIQNDHCVTGNKIKDQPVQNKYEIKRTINIKNDTSTAAKEKITNSDSTSGIICLLKNMRDRVIFFIFFNYLPQQFPFSGA